MVVLTAHGSIGKAVEAMREGAIDFLVKPFSAERLTSATALANVRRELTELAAAAGRVRSAGPELAALKASLKGVNEDELADLVTWSHGRATK